MFQVTTLSKEDINSSKNSKIDYSKDFLEKTSLTVSGQLEAELGALSLGRFIHLGRLLGRKLKYIKAFVRILDD